MDIVYWLFSNYKFLLKNYLNFATFLPFAEGRIFFFTVYWFFPNRESLRWFPHHENCSQSFFSFPSKYLSPLSIFLLLFMPPTTWNDYSLCKTFVWLCERKNNWWTTPCGDLFLIFWFLTYFYDFFIDFSIQGKRKKSHGEGQEHPFLGSFLHFYYFWELLI